MLYTNNSELYDILKSVLYEEFEGEEADQILLLLWKMFSEYASSKTSERDTKLIESIMKEIDQYFDSSQSNGIKGEI